MELVVPDRNTDAMTDRRLPPVADLIALAEQGLSYAEIGSRFGCGAPAVQRHMTRAGYRSPTVRKAKPMAERIEAFIDRNGPVPDYRPDLGPCWLWTGTLDHNGYGAISQDHKWKRAHRVVYEVLRVPIPTGLTIDHLCRVIACVNPDHLEPVTMRENVLRSDSPSAKAARATECPKGHPYDEANTRRDIRGDRFCRQCKTDYSREWYRKRAAARRAAS